MVGDRVSRITGAWDGLLVGGSTGAWDGGRVIATTGEPVGALVGKGDGGFVSTNGS